MLFQPRQHSFLRFPERGLLFTFTLYNNVNTQNGRPPQRKAKGEEKKRKRGRNRK